MQFSSIDLEKALRKEKKRSIQKDLIEEINAQLESDFKEDCLIEERIKSKSNSTASNFHSGDLENVFNLDQIKSICVKYRLRFLEAAAYKAELPAEAILKVKSLEKKWGVELKNFKIVAPQSLFELEDPDADPLLFAELGNNKYYFIHKWGSDLNGLRALAAFPLRSFMHLFWTLLTLALIFAAIIPTPTLGLKLFVWIHSFIAFCALACVYVFGMRQNFSSESWNSKFM